MVSKSAHVELAVICITYGVWGSLYAFPLYLPDIKDKLQLTQVGINLVGASIYVSTTLIAVPLVPFARNLMGDRVVSIVGGVLAPLALLILWLIVDGVIVGNLAMAMFAGTILGLSTGVYFVLLLDLGMQRYPPTSAVIIIAITSVFYAGGGVVISAIYLEAINNVATLLLLLISLHLGSALFMVVTVFVNHSPETKKVADMDESLLVSAVEGEVKVVKGGVEHTTVMDAEETDWDKRVAHAKSMRSWLTALVVCLKIGIGSTFTTNLGSISASLAPNDANFNAEIVLAFAISQAAGRILVTVVSSETVLKKVLGRHHQPDPMYAPTNPSLAVVLFVAVAYIVVFLVSIFTISRDTLLAITCSFGIAYGAMWTESANLMAYTARPAMKDWGLAMGMLMPFGGIGSLVLNAVAGLVYDAAGQGRVCTGTECYLNVWIMLTVLSGVMAVAVIALMISWGRTKRLVSSM